MIAGLSSTHCPSWRSTNHHRSRREAGRRCQRIVGMERGSSLATTRITTSDKSSPSAPRRMSMVCLLVAACFSTSCSSFATPRQTNRPFAFRTVKQQRGSPSRSSFTVSSSPASSSLFSNTNTIIDEFAEENVSSSNRDIGDSNVSSSLAEKNLAFDDVAESPAPPLNYEKYLTMQKKRVHVTIRYSPNTGLKPYYLTVAKRVKYQYPDVLIEREEISGTAAGGDASDGENSGVGTFEVIVDGKIVVRTNQRNGGASNPQNGGSIFVSMTEMELAIARARKRRRPSTAYGENGKLIADGGEAEFVKSRLEVLKQKARELQSKQGSGASQNSSAGSD